MEMHFCMGEQTGLNFYISSGDACASCGMKEKKGGCCSDEQKFIKLSDDHKTSSLHYLDDVVSPVTRHPKYLYVKSVAFYTASFPLQDYTDIGPPLYLTNRVFRI